MRTTTRLRSAFSLAFAIGAVSAVAGVAVPARADTPEETFIKDIERANAATTPIPGTPERWVAAGYASCGRISSTIAQGLPARAAINNEVIAATTFHRISRQNAVALVTYAVLDLCPQVVPPRDNGAALPETELPAG